MRCANCGAEVAEGTVFCPSCGHRVRRSAQSGGAPARERPAPAHQPPRRPVDEPLMREEPLPEEAPVRVSGCRWVALTGLFTLLFLVIIVGLGALGVYHGLQDQTREKLRLAQEHYQKAEIYLQEGQRDLAIAELEEALRLNPDYAEATAKLEAARSDPGAQPTPTPDAQLELTENLYNQGRTLYDQQEWDAAIARFEELRALDPTYQQGDVGRLLFWSYYNSGLALVNQGRMQEALHRFDSALEVHPDHPDALGQQNLATLYATGLGYWQADWPAAIARLKDVYAIEPNYRDVRQRLHDAHVFYGDFLAQQGRWCDAQDQYAAALQVISTQEITNRQADAASRCAGVTPAPGTPDPAVTPAPQGTFVGELTGYDPIASRDAQIRGRVLDRVGNPVSGQVVRIQAFDWTTFATTDSIGEFGFEALNQELTFTLTLLELPHEPLEVPAQFGQRALVVFREQP